MNESQEGPTAIARPGGRAELLAACGWLALVVALTSPAVLWYGQQRAGLTGIGAALTAVSMCWLGATLALVVTAMFRGPAHGATGVLLAMAFRLGLPLGGALALGSAGGPLAGTGLLGMTVSYYLVTLVAETLLAVRLVQPAAKAPKVA